MKTMPRMLLCETPKAGETVLLLASGNEVTIEAASGEGKLPRFSMVAYTGGPMVTSFSPRPVVVDLNGLDIPSQSLPIRLQHEARLGVGHSDSIKKEGGMIRASGFISRSTPEAQEVVASAKNGFPWQASIGATVLQYEVLAEGKAARVNGQTVNGPALIITKATLNEISFVDLGADRKTAASVAAAAALGLDTGGKDMQFNEWLKAKGFDPASLSEAQRESLKAMFDAEQKAVKAAAQTQTQTVQAGAAPAPIQGQTQADPIQAQREALARETERVAAITAAFGGRHNELLAKAIRENWSTEKAELEAMRADRPSGVPNIVSINAPVINASVMEAAICKANKLGNVEKLYNDKDLEAADKAFRGGIGLQQLLLHAAWEGGYHGHVVNVGTIREVLRAAFSNVNIPGILSNSANKFVLESFSAVESVWRKIAAIRAVKDFKTVTRYRLTGAAQYEKVAPSGELKHGQLGEASFTNKADTYGILFGISRTDIINDDLGALADMPRRIGRGAALKLNDVFWAAFLNNSAFFASGNSNYLSGAGSALGIDGLAAADTAFANQTDNDGKPLAIAPAILLVPNALKAKAKQLMASLEIRDTTASTKTPVANPFAGMFEAVASAYLSNSAYTGYSAAAWYLLANPADLAVMEVCFLNGNETPVVETADADFNSLGIQMRGYHDFGATKAEHRAGVKSAGS